MRSLAVLVLIALASRVAEAEPIRVRVECENSGRTKACPAFLLGFVDAREVLLQSPRATADVIVYANATQVALVDRVHLRFVSRMAGAPPIIELDVDLDTRVDDDTQRAQLEPAFLRGIALYVAARFPKVVTVAIGTPEGDEAKAQETSALDVALNLSGFGNRSGVYQNYNASSSFSVAHTTPMRRFGALTWANGGVNRQPPLELDDGTLVSVDTNNYGLGVAGETVTLLNRCYSVGAKSSVWRDDPKGQYRYGWDAKLGLEWDRFQSDDPRGNRLALFYLVGYQVDGYNIRNEIGERFAHYPFHSVGAAASVRKDKVLLGLDVQARSEMLHPLRRHRLSASPRLEVQIGPHVDIGLSFSITKRELPAPDASQVDPTDFAQLSRLAYAEPLSMSGSFNLRIHWDRSNGARNDRLRDP